MFAAPIVASDITFISGGVRAEINVVNQQCGKRARVMYAPRNGECYWIQIKTYRFNEVKNEKFNYSSFFILHFNHFLCPKMRSNMMKRLMKSR